MSRNEALFVAHRVAETDAFLRDWGHAALAPTPFQSAHWLAGWYRHIGSDPSLEALLIDVREAATGQLAYALPLVLDRRGARARITFADLGVSDYNMPLIGPVAPSSPAMAKAAWAAVKAVLPTADLCVFEKMPRAFGGRPNPLLLALGGHPATVFGSHVTPGDDYDAWLFSLGKHHRKELARFWRVFTREADARFVHAKTPEQARPILHWIEKMQGARGAELGYTYLLDKPAYRDLYRDLLEDGVEKGNVIVTALIAGEEIVGALYGVADGTHYAMVRIATAGGEWANCSPGRLVIERSINALHAEGYRWFDFTIGDYAYKRRFETTTLPLFDVTLALSLAGLPRMAISEAKAYVKRNPRLDNLARRAMGWRRAAPAPPVPESAKAG